MLMNKKYLKYIEKYNKDDSKLTKFKFLENN